MAIEQMLQALDEEQLGGNSDSVRLALLRARLVADFSEGLSADATAPDVLDTRLLNDLAAHLEGHSLGEDREALVAALAQQPQSRAALDSAIAFLADLQDVQTPVSAALLKEAMAIFGPAERAAAAAIPAQRAAGKGFNWQTWSAMAAVLLVGVIGGGQLWQFTHMSTGPAGASSMPGSSIQAPSAAPAANAGHGEMRVQRPGSAAAVKVPPAANSSAADCNAERAGAKRPIEKLPLQSSDTPKAAAPQAARSRCGPAAPPAPAVPSSEVGAPPPVQNTAPQ
jgi:hypothetical protein